MVKHKAATEDSVVQMACLGHISVDQNRRKQDKNQYNCFAS